MRGDWLHNQLLRLIIDYVLSGGKSHPGMKISTDFWPFKKELLDLITDVNEEVPMRVLTEFKTIKALEENNVNWEFWG